MLHTEYILLYGKGNGKHTRGDGCFLLQNLKVDNVNIFTEEWRKDRSTGYQMNKKANIFHSNINKLRHSPNEF